MLRLLGFLQGCIVEFEALPFTSSNIHKLLYVFVTDLSQIYLIARQRCVSAGHSGVWVTVKQDGQVRLGLASLLPKVVLQQTARDHPESRDAIKHNSRSSESI